MVVCSTCSTPNQATAKFCSECGVRMNVVPPPEEQERKVVSVLFCDLVGFTATSDGADPEDVHAVLGPYHARTKAEIESFGGTVEKFIGDAVMAVFGAPVAHEDDPERAALAALAVLAAVPELNAEHGLDLSVRLGVATGEVVVSVDARPERGEGLVAGDVVNLAARLQTVAPVGGVVVDGPTRAASLASVRYGECATVVLKGKRDAVHVWPALAPRSSTGEALDHAVTPMVGRGDALRSLQQAYAAAVEHGASRLVSIVGDPGLGKSRLLQAFRDWIEGRDELVTWRQGRCAAFGTGASVSALAEVVQAQVGVDAADPPSARRARLEESVGSLLDGAVDSRGDWLVDRLAPLVGLEAAPVAPDELFVAWAGFFELVAGRRPAVVVIEDLHWAAPQLLDFLPQLLRATSSVPLLILVTARPEISELRAGRDPIAGESTVRLQPLDERSTSSLLSGLVGSDRLPEATRAALLRRCGGNPLYVLELVRLVDQQEQRGVGPATPDAVMLPSTVQSIIAARLDAMPRSTRTLVRAAAVLGDHASSSALAELVGRSSTELEPELMDLVSRSVLRRKLDGARSDGEAYEFAHALIGEVAYGQLARPTRARYHLGAATWLAEWSAQSAGGPDDVAVVVAEHAALACRLFAALRIDTVAERRAGGLALTWQLRAGRVSVRTDAGAAARHLRSALALMGDEDDRRPGLLLELALTNALSVDETRELCVEARQAAQDRGDVTVAALALVRRAPLELELGRRRECRELLLQAVVELEQIDPGPALADACAWLAFISRMGVRYDDAIHWAARCLEVAELIGLGPGPVLADVLLSRGFVRIQRADLDGQHDLETALAITRRQNLTRKTIKILGTMSGVALQSSFPAMLALDREVAELVTRVDPLQAHLYQGNLLFSLVETGRVAEAAQLLPSLRAPLVGTPTRSTGWLACANALVLMMLEDEPGATAAGWWALPACRSDEDFELIIDLLVLLETGATDGSSRHVLEVELHEVVARRGPESSDLSMFPWLGRTLLAQGRADLVEGIRGTAPTHHPLGVRCRLTLDAMLAEHAEEFQRAEELYAEAAAGWDHHGAPLEQAAALLGQARCRARVGLDPGPQLDESERLAAASGAPWWQRQVREERAVLRVGVR